MLRRYLRDYLSRYYAMDFFSALAMASVFVYGWWQEPENLRLQLAAALSLISFPLMPLSVLGMENLLLKFISQRALYFLLRESTHSLYPLFAAFCFFFAVPIALTCLLLRLRLKRMD